LPERSDRHSERSETLNLMREEGSDDDVEDMEGGGDRDSWFYRYFPRDAIVSEILEGKLYLTDRLAANDLTKMQKHGIRCIIALGNFHEHTVYDVHENITYNHIFIDDWETEPIQDYFTECIDFIKGTDGPVLVHCYAGISRSATIVIAYIMITLNMVYDDALQFVRSKRPIVNPNSGFEQSLRIFGASLPPV
jgi:predicted protein tyrosine phosphatase